MVKCPQCGHENLEGAAFCDECGASLLNLAPQPATAGEATNTPAATAAPAQATPPAEATAGGKKCPQCGTENGPNDRFCFNCGAPLVSEQPQAAQPVEQTPEPVAPAVEQSAPPPVVPPVTATPMPQQQPAPATASGTAGTRLVLPDGTELPIPNKPEILLGREDPVSGIFPDIDLTPYGGEEGGVSRRHARILNQNGQYNLEDLNSTNFTFVNKQKLTPKTPRPLQNGDEIRMGRVTMTFHQS